MPAFGRSPDELTMLPGVMPVVGRTDKASARKLAVLQSFVDSHNGLQLLTDRLGFDMTSTTSTGQSPSCRRPSSARPSPVSCWTRRAVTV